MEHAVMKKLWLVAIVAACAAFMVAGCESKSQAVTRTQTSASASITVYLKDGSEEMSLPPAIITYHSDWVSVEGLQLFGTQVRMRTIKTWPKNEVAKVMEIPGFQTK